MRECTCITIKEGTANRHKLVQELRDAGYTGLITTEWTRGPRGGEAVVSIRAKLDDAKVATIVANMGDKVIRTR